MRRPKPLSRQQFYAKSNRAAQQRFKTAADERMIEGAPSENNQAFPVMLREPYQFPPDPSESTPDEIISQSGCQQISEEL